MTDTTRQHRSEPVKGMPCEVYSRIVGYLRPVQDWNEGKQQEFAERKAYDVHEAERRIEHNRLSPDAVS